MQRKTSCDTDRKYRIARTGLHLIQDHCDAARNADQDEATHIGGLAAKKHYGEDKHQCQTDKPVMDQRQPEHSLVAKDNMQLFVSNLRQRREHHDGQTNGDRNIRCAALEAIDEPCGAWDEVTKRYSDIYREEYPQRKEVIEEREMFPP